MHITMFTKNLTDPEKESFEAYFRKKTARFEKLLTHFDEDTVKMNVNAEKFIRKAAFKVEMFMELPKASKKPLYASEDSRDLYKAIDFCTDKLVEQVKKGIEKMQHENEHAA